MEQRLSAALDSILQGLEKGQTLDDLLEKYPDLADELRSLVESALLVPKARANRAEVQAMRSRLDAKFDSQISAMQFPKRQSRRPLLALVASLAIVIFGVWILLLRGDMPSPAEIQLTQSQIEASQTAILTLSPSSTPTSTETEAPSSTPTSTESETLAPSSTATTTQAPTQRTAIGTPSPSPSSASTSASSQAASCTPRTNWETYIIRSGDTLSQIAVDSNSTVNELLAANCLSNARGLIVGQRIYVPRLWEDDEDNSGTPEDDAEDDASDNDSEVDDDSGSSDDDDAPDDDSEDDDDNSGSSDDDEPDDDD